VLGLSASARFVGAALVADGRVLRLFCQRVAAERPLAVRAIRSSLADILRTSGVRTVVLVVAAASEAERPSAMTDALSEVLGAFPAALKRLSLGDVAHDLGLGTASVIEVARLIAARDPVVGAYFSPRDRGPRSEAERYWEHAAVAAAAALAIGEATDLAPC
jgi:hypothetical protein